ncbi:YHS domain-containing protein [Sediminibacterium sp.]|uniref:YHS domain-containing protein n=1 Tax=Sediminibacterium sp. TaxID=1917865 RepID=UPI0027359F12|nr:YHS domain-containing protein [Sediminibacterium sp.]MDP3394115.1 YHS domain-containing protein [Sediminibacterium sp.]MDP3566296.1 YHS domain-containing protein [Sediminibacterium sp.]
MHLKFSFSALLIAFLFASCANSETASSPSLEPVKHGTTMQVAVSDSLKKFTAEMVSNKRDFICGMPVTAGIADTAHYKGKVYGFCASECKDEFLKSPDAYTANK